MCFFFGWVLVIYCDLICVGVCCWWEWDICGYAAVVFWRVWDCQR